MGERLSEKVDNVDKVKSGEKGEEKGGACINFERRGE